MARGAFMRKSSNKRKLSALTAAWSQTKKKSRTISETKAQREERLDREYIQQRLRDPAAIEAPTKKTKPLDILGQAEENNDTNNIYVGRLQNLPRDPPTTLQRLRLELAGSLAPNYLGRTASQTSGRKFDSLGRRSNGFTSATVLLPAADRNRDQACHGSILDMSQGELIYMIGKHLIWHDLRSDELLSYSKDPLFLVVHGLNRMHRGESEVTIQFFDRRKAKTVTDEFASFYSALSLYETFQVIRWPGWDQPARIALHPRKFTQEFLSHGAVVLDDSILQPARLEDLIRDGLFDLMPEFEVPDDHKRGGLYGGQVVLRKQGYPSGEVQPREYPRLYSYMHCARAINITESILQIVSKLTLNFARDKDREPPLHIFLSFLTFQKRESQDPVFLSYIKDHYTAADVLDLYTDEDGCVLDGFTTVANNLPGCMQYIDLVRDCIEVFKDHGLPRLPTTIVEEQHAFHIPGLLDYRYADVDAKEQRYERLSTPWSKEVQDAKRGVKRKRKDEKRAKQAAADREEEDRQAEIADASELGVTGAATADEQDSGISGASPPEIADEPVTAYAVMDNMAALKAGAATDNDRRGSLEAE